MGIGGIVLLAVLIFAVLATIYVESAIHMKQENSDIFKMQDQCPPHKWELTPTTLQCSKCKNFAGSVTSSDQDQSQF